MRQVAGCLKMEMKVPDLLRWYLMGVTILMAGWLVVVLVYLKTVPGAVWPDKNALAWWSVGALLWPIVVAAIVILVVGKIVLDLMMKKEGM